MRGVCVKWGFPKIRGTILGVPRIRIIVFWGLYWGPYQISFSQNGLRSVREPLHCYGLLAGGREAIFG